MAILGPISKPPSDIVLNCPADTFAKQAVGGLTYIPGLALILRARPPYSLPQNGQFWHIFIGRNLDFPVALN